MNKETIKNTAKQYLKWYFYPLIYFFVSGLVCLYAWYGPYPKGAVKIIFQTIVIIPTVFGIAIITLWIIVSVIGSLYFKKKPPKDISEELKEKVPYSLQRKFLNSILYTLGTLLVVVGIFLMVWVARPYVSLLLSSSKVEELEKKAVAGMVQDNRIIIPSVLVDAPIIEGISMPSLSRGVCRIESSPLPGEGGNCIIEGHNLAEFGFWKPQSFFSILEVVEKGAPIYLFYNGRKFTYEVKEKTYRNVDDPNLYDMNTGERLTLITCVSTWSPNIYTKRRTVIIAYPDFR